jgi:RNA polymerase sigma-70 factor, ECF subfamily
MGGSSVATSVPVRLLLVRGGGGESASDADVARALIAGDRTAELVAWTRFLPYVRGNVRRLVGPGYDEDDLCQEVFLRFFRRARDLREPEAIRGFLFGICLRVAKREVRRRWLKRWLRLTDHGTLPEPSAGDGGAADRAAGEAREAVHRYYRILDAIGGQGRSLFVTRNIEGIELAEVARLHGLSISTTQRRLARVSKRIEAMVQRDPLLAEMVAHEGGHPR